MRALFGSPALFVQTLLVLYCVPILTGALLIALEVQNLRKTHVAAAEHSATVLARTIQRIPVPQRPMWLQQLTQDSDDPLRILQVALYDADDTLIAGTEDFPSESVIVVDARNRAGERLRIAVPQRPVSGIWVRGLSLSILVALSATVAFCIAVWPTVFSMRRSLEEVMRALNTYRQSNFEARIAENGYGRFGLLEKSVNRTGDALQNAQDKTREVVSHTTDELQSTLEEVEIKNVELDLARKRAVEDARAKSNFLANMSHEIRTPMNSIVGYTQLLDSTSLDAAQRGYAEHIGQSARTLLEIIEDILSLSRLEAGKLVLATQEFDIRHIAEQSVEMLAPAAYQKNLDVRTVVAPDVPACFVGDPMRVRQILVNFLTNAVKFTDQGSVTLYIDAERQTDTNAVLTLRISDTGRGISRDDRRKLFDAFTDISRREMGGGAGLGLTIARALTDVMGGQISLQSEVGQGSSFAVHLPLKTNYALSFDFLGIVDGQRVALALADETLDSHLTQSFKAADIVVASSEPWLAWTTPAKVPNADFVILEASVSDVPRLTKLWQDRWPTPIILVASADTGLHQELMTATNGYALAAHVSATRIIAQMAFHLGGDVSQIESQVASLPLPSANGARVLIADDDRLGRSYLEELLAQHGVEVTACADGEQAVTVAREVEFDAIFLDARMPVCDGEQAARQIRSRSRNMRTAMFALTASAMDDDRQRYQAAGMDGCLIKPASIRGLLTLIATGQQRRSEGAAAKAAVTNDQQMTTMLREELARYRDALSDDDMLSDYERLYEMAHKLHGAAAICQLPTLRRDAAGLEDAARAGDALAIEKSCAAV
ncbi:MAG: ATP-binding protein, partial [Gammaproteobacteria bacterium]